MLTVPLNLLRSGAAIGIDSRRTSFEIESLAASIKLKGLLQPLGVTPLMATVPPEEGGHVHYVAFGNRRLLALMALSAVGEIERDWPVPVVIREETQAELLESSMAENIERLGLHPVDVYEDFAELEAGGMARSKIASRFHMSVARVRQHLALGKLAPEVRAAWRAGELSEDSAKAFTLEPDPARQAQALAGLEAHYKQPHNVRSALVGEQNRLAKFFKFVGEKAYTASGGRLTKDLFDEKAVYIADGDKLLAMATELLDAQAQTVNDDGWGAVFTEFTKPDDWYSFSKVGTPVFTPEQQARLDELDGDEHGLSHNEVWHETQQINEAARLAGLTPDAKLGACCCVYLSYDGTPIVELGRARLTASEHRAAETGAPKVVKDEGAEPQPVLDKLHDAMTTALGRTLAQDPTAAFDVLLAALLQRPLGGSPIIVKVNGAHQLAKHLAAVRGDIDGYDFADTLAMITMLSTSEKNRLLTSIVASAVDAGARAQASTMFSYTKGVTTAGINAVAGRLDAISLDLHAREAFDAVAYFHGAKRTHCAAAVMQSLGPDLAQKWVKAKKGELADFCVSNVAPTGWLPEALRTPGYVHPYNPLHEPTVRAPAPKTPARRAMEAQVAADRHD